MNRNFVDMNKEEKIACFDGVSKYLLLVVCEISYEEIINVRVTYKSPIKSKLK
jgi:hypothetical protein